MHRQIKLNFRNSPFSNLPTVSFPRNDVLAKHFQIFKGKGSCGKFEEFKFANLRGEAKEESFHGSMQDTKGMYVAQY